MIRPSGVTITNVNEAPVITSNGGGASASISMGENGTAVTTVIAADPEGDVRSYSIVGGADVALFTIDSVTGVLTFIGAPNFEAPTDAGGNNIYDVIVRASSTGGTDDQAIAVTITNVNEAPVISSNGGGASASISMGENGTAVTTVIASDPEGDVRSYSIVGGADGALFAIDSVTGALTFIGAPNFEGPTDAGGNNIYDVIVRASSTGGTDDQSIAVTITNVNEAPVITSNGGGATASVSIAENTTSVTTVTSTDPKAMSAAIPSLAGRMRRCSRLIASQAFSPSSARRISRPRPMRAAITSMMWWCAPARPAARMIRASLLL